MANDPHAEAALALHRFGMGPRAGSIAAIASDPRGALLAELERAGGGRVADANLMTSAQASRAVFEFRQERQARAKVEADRKRLAENPGMDDAAEPPLEMAPEPAQAEMTPPLPQQILLAEAKARHDAAFDAELGFVERLVWFWSNHFCISADKIPSMTGAYEREAIRPHVVGRFADMLQAVEGHPAMLFYLDNSASIGPKSVAGINRSRGLNENLAREILELHTLGVNGGYTQADVTRFAYVLTGWTLTGTGNPDHGGEFTFVRRMHEPGPQQILDKVYPDSSVEQGRAVLSDLARHPATATHIATKLARHFVADAPPPALIETLAKTVRDTDGDLKAVSAALIKAPESWIESRSKLKRPSEWIISVRRATGLRGDPVRVVRSQTQLGEPLWRPSAPQGFSDYEAAWIDGLAQRLDVANAYAQRVEDRVDPKVVLETALGPLATADTRQAVSQAESRVQALALLVMAPEFQRR
jgi:uncharacterized protein (DUF1800 family)